MKLLTKLSLVAAIFAAIRTTSAFADDPQLQNRLALDRVQNSAPAQPTTVAVYANQHSVGRTEISMYAQQPESRFELHSNGHGQTFGLWVESK
jgi:hypothetical protein